MRRTYKFRIYPNKGQGQLLERTLNTCRHLYNDSLADRKKKYAEEGKSLSYYEQKRGLVNLKEKDDNHYLREVHSQVLQDVILRLNKSFLSFFRRVKSGEKPGYPRFRGRNRYDSFTYPQYGNGCEIRDGKLWLSKIGNIRIFLHRPIEGAIKNCAIRRDVDRWYACFFVEIPNVVIEKKEPRNAIGVDVGLESLLTLSSGDKIEPPEFLRRAEMKLAVEQRRQSRKQRGSMNRQRQRIRVAKVHRKIREQRTDFNHKISKMLVSNYDLIAFENLNIQNMMQNHYLAKSIADASWSQLMLFTRYKAEDAGIGVEFVDARGTSQMCSGCGRVVAKTLAARTHNCPFCGLSIDRDVNAARNIIARTVGQTGRARGGIAWASR